MSSRSSSLSSWAAGTPAPRSAEPASVPSTQGLRCRRVAAGPVLSPAMPGPRASRPRAPEPWGSRGHCGKGLSQAEAALPSVAYSKQNGGKRDTTIKNAESRLLGTRCSHDSPDVLPAHRPAQGARPRESHAGCGVPDFKAPRGDFPTRLRVLTLPARHNTPPPFEAGGRGPEPRAAATSRSWGREKTGVPWSPREDTAGPPHSLEPPGGHGREDAPAFGTSDRRRRHCGRSGAGTNTTRVAGTPTATSLPSARPGYGAPARPNHVSELLPAPPQERGQGTTPFLRP